MRKIILIFTFLLLAIPLKAQEYFADTVEAGSSDSIYAPTLYGEPDFITITFIQLDTNATFPDSVVVELMGVKGYAGIIGFHKSATDSTLDVVTLTYRTGIATQYLTRIVGWVWLPYVTGIRFRLFNQKYLAGRRIYVIGEYH